MPLSYFSSRLGVLLVFCKVDEKTQTTKTQESPDVPRSM